MDYLKIPFFDNHTHPIDADKTTLTPDQFALIWLHGFRDLPNRGVSEKFNHHVCNQGCVHTAINQMSKLFGCECSLKAVVEERNRRLANSDVKAYTEMLYKDAGIFCTLVDCGLPLGDSQLDLFPGKVIRHIQMDPIYWNLLKEKDNYASMLDEYKAQIKKAILEDGFVSIKGHIGELFTMKVRFVSTEEAELSFAYAKNGDKKAQQTVYYAIFHQTMLLANELDVPIHVHSGMTGGFWDGEMDDADPYRIAPFLRNVPHMMKTTLVLLHSNYPFMSSAALVAHTFPNVWVDLAWVLPWVSLEFTQCIEDLISIAPVSKILLGSGQHNIPEIAWLSSKVARQSLKYVMGKLVSQEMLSEEQAFEIAEMIMYKNACRLYNCELK